MLIIFSLKFLFKHIPDHDGGVFGFLASLYRGTGSAFTGSTMRSGYVTATKNNKVVEEVRENEIERSSNKITAEKIGYVGATAFGEICREIIKQMQDNPQKGMEIFVKDFSKQLPLRMVNTIIVFAIVAGLGEMLGKEPFTNMLKSEPSQKLFGFFSNSDKKIAEQANRVDETPEENDNLSNKKH